MQLWEQGLTPASPPWTLDPTLGLELLESMLLARHLDYQAHQLKSDGVGHYTICSTGHEANVVLGRLTRPTDPSLVHYRSCALVLERARQVPDFDAPEAIALSLVAAGTDPVSGGRHKVFGGKPLGILPQTSTIASHLPRALGLAHALELRRKLGLPELGSPDSIVMASFGDASINHSTATGSFNATAWARARQLPLPLLLVCEDNGLGISVAAPAGWTAQRLRSLPEIRYFHAHGSLMEIYQVASEAMQYCRQRRAPAVLHLECRRILGHAGSDVDTNYRQRQEIEEAIALDPVLAQARSLLAADIATASDLIELDSRCGKRAQRAADTALAAPALLAENNMKPLQLDEAALWQRFEPRAEPEPGPEQSLAQGINEILSRGLASDPKMVVFGEDVGRKGGVYGVTKGLREKHGETRVFDTLLDESTILGLALGAAGMGLIPVAEIQYLAYLHNAIDQLRGEAMTLPYFSNGEYANPMMLRIASFGYQRGFGGHFHNDNSFTAIRDIPGLIVMVPVTAEDARELYELAYHLLTRERRVVVALEPIALYHERDIYEKGDGQWLNPRDRSRLHGPLRVYAGPKPQDSSELSPQLVMISYGNGVRMCLRAARQLEQEGTVGVIVIDLRMLIPLPWPALLDELRSTDRILIVDEGRRRGSLSEELLTGLAEAQLAAQSIRRVCSPDELIPLGAAAIHAMLDEASVVRIAREMITSPTADAG